MPTAPVYIELSDGSREELWRSNGTEAGTAIVQDINIPAKFGTNFL